MFSAMRSMRMGIPKCLTRPTARNSPPLKRKISYIVYVRPCKDAEDQHLKRQALQNHLTWIAKQRKTITSDGQVHASFKVEDGMIKDGFKYGLHYDLHVRDPRTEPDSTGPFFMAFEFPVYLTQAELDGIVKANPGIRRVEEDEPITNCDEK